MADIQLSKAARALCRKILSDDEARLLAKHLKEVMGQEFVDLVEQYEIDVNASLRFMSVASRVQEARQKKKLALKDAATALKVPQYRLRDIEQGRLKQIVANILVQYVGFLGLKTWFGRWRKANPGVVHRLGL